MSDKPSSSSAGAAAGDVVEINVGGVVYTTSRRTLVSDHDSVLSKWFGPGTDSEEKPLVRDGQGRCFIDRDGVLFRYILDYLRCGQLVLPESFRERSRLRQEAEYYGLAGMLKQISGVTVTPNGSFLTLAGAADGGEPGFILVGYRGTFQFGRDGLADVKFLAVSLPFFFFFILS